MSKVDASKPEMPDFHIGSYQVLQPLGLGGMSSVFRAVHSATGHEVALKVLPRALAKNPTMLQRFLREARSAESLQHPNIVSIYDRGVDQGRHYLVLEFVPGGDFHDYVRRNGPLEILEAVSVVKQTARGLAYAADRGVIHRDVKPSNLLRTPAGQVKIIDLGLAVQADNEDERVTREGTTVGTVDFMAPEQARDSRATTVQSDMYSLGCAFYFLLTGSPPYPGGDVTDKLSRHAATPAPDPRELRPDLPDPVARIVVRLMAKNPQDRYASYESLIADLDAVPRSLRQAPSVLRVGGGGSSAPDPTSSGSADSDGGSSPSLIPLLSLAALAADHEAPASVGGPGTLTAAPRRTVDRLPSALFSESDLPAASGEAPAPRSAHGGFSRRGGANSDVNWIMAWVLLGAATVVVVIGLDQLIRRSIVAPDVVPAPATNFAVPPFGGWGGADSSSRPAAHGSGGARPQAGSNGRTRDSDGGAALERAWREPRDLDPRIPPEKTYPSAVLAEFVPEWAIRPEPATIPTRKVVVRRIADSADADSAPTLRQALDMARGEIELAGDGPFLIDDFRIPGESRTIRAAPGFRPIIQVEASDLEIVRRQSAVVVLEGKSLVLDGLDLVVDARAFGEKRPSSLFQCSGAELTLRNCTITLIGRPGAGLELVRTLGGARPSRIRLIGTFIRAGSTPAFHLQGAGDGLVLDGSVVLAGGGPIVQCERSGSAAVQNLALIRSVLGGRGPIVEVRGKVDAGAPPPVSIRMLGSAIGRFQGAGIAGVVVASEPMEAMNQAVDWRGRDNKYAGWKGYFASGAEPKIVVGGFAELRSTWNESDHDSRATPLGWGPLLDPVLATTRDLAPYLVREGATLARVAQPSPYLLEKTVGSFPPPEIPQPSDAPPRRSGAGGTVDDPPRPGRLDLVFSTQDPEFNGDLGGFIAGRIPADAGWARIVVQGGGRHGFTPVRLTPGLTLEVQIESPAVADEDQPSWSPVSSESGVPLIDVKGGQLMLNRFRVDAPDESRISNVVRIEDGHLVLQECRFVRRGAADEAQAPLVEFLAPTTRPVSVAYGRSILTPQIDRPVCRLIGSVLITDGSALSCETGRGLIALSNCAVAAGRTAIELTPTEVSRHRFDSDLWIDRCTITSDHDVIRVGPWPGGAPGPDRPWVVYSSNNAYLAAFGGQSGPTVMLNGDGDGLAHSSYFWQGVNDALEVEHFLASDDVKPVAGRGRDVVLHWINYWGAGRVRSTSGPRLSNRKPTVRLLQKLQFGRVEPSDLILDSDYHPGRSRLDLGADLESLGVKRRPPGAHRP